MALRARAVQVDGRVHRAGGPQRGVQAARREDLVDRAGRAGQRGEDGGRGQRDPRARQPPPQRP
ncbi:Uncharacterised protein [Mycobacterium tuberculosis]|nr:Uncharacterised protein [Mycobacterium tuberculosis]